MFILELISKRVALKLRYGSTIFQDFTQVHCSSLGAREGVCSCLVMVQEPASLISRYLLFRFEAQLPKCLCCNWGQKPKCIKIPSHPQAGLTRRQRRPILSSFFRSITLCKNSCCLTGDVFIKLSELI